MSRAQLLDLAARVEAVKGADRELDRAIAMTAMPPRRRGMYVRRHYTASLDAAASLVPEGGRWEIGVIDGDASAAVWRRMGWKGWVCAATPALALTAAALRALAEDAE